MYSRLKTVSKFIATPDFMIPNQMPQDANSDASRDSIKEQSTLVRTLCRERTGVCLEGALLSSSRGLLLGQPGVMHFLIFWFSCKIL